MLADYCLLGAGDDMLVGGQDARDPLHERKGDHARVPRTRRREV